MNLFRNAGTLAFAGLLAFCLHGSDVSAEDFIPEPDVIYYGQAPAGEVVQIERGTNQPIGTAPLAEDKPGRHVFDCEASARNRVFPPGLTAEMLAADPDMLRARPVNVKAFWDPASITPSIA
jgi:hypothetical protein